MVLRENGVRSTGGHLEGIRGASSLKKVDIPKWRERIVAKTSTKLTRRNKIIDAALKTFAEKGFQDATISEISKAAGVSDATVYEYFNSKEELLFAIPENITKEPLEQMERMLPFLRGADNKVRAIVLGYMILYESNPLYSALVMLQLKSNRNFLRTGAYQQIRRISQILLTCIQKASTRVSSAGMRTPT